MVVHKREMTLDGIAYEITVRDEASGYFGAWFCKSCQKGGVRYELQPLIADALELAKGEVATHHLEKHKKSISN